MRMWRLRGGMDAGDAEVDAMVGWKGGGMGGGRGEQEWLEWGGSVHKMGRGVEGGKGDWGLLCA